MTENLDPAQPLSDLTAINPRYRSLISAGTAVLWTTDPQGNFVEPQTPWTAYTGQDWAAHRGSGWLNAVHPDDRQRVIILWSAALKHGSSFEARGRIWHEASQSYRYFVSRAVPVADGDGGIREWVGALTDVDELARAEAAQREYGALSAFAADVGTALVQRDPLPGVLQRCAASIVLHLGATFARIWTLTDDLQVLELQASAGLYTHKDGPHSRIPIGQYKIGLIAAERKPHLTNEVVGDARIHDQQWAKDIGLVAFAGYPLLVDDRLVGVMAMFARHRLSVTTIDALAAVANSVAIGIDRKRAEERVGEQARIMQTLNRVGATVASELDRETIVQTVTDAATELTTAAYGAFFYNVIDPKSGDAFMLYTLSGAPKEASEKFPQPRATALFGPMFRGEGVVRIADVLLDPRYSKSAPYYGMPHGHLPVRSHMGVPVKGRDGEVIGGLFFGHPQPGVFTEQHERLAVGIASWASVALENARLYERAQEVSRAKDEFLAVLSHELRTPLNAILGWSRMLRDGHVAPARVEHAVSVIERNARLQTQLVEDLLDVSRIVSGKLRLDIRPVDLPAILQSAMDAVRPATTNKNIQVTARIRPDIGRIHGDADRIEQVVWNLLANAVKFTEPGGRIDVELRQTDHSAEIVVSDDGQGIAPDFLPHVFDRFRQADAGVSRKHGGLGLGLALVRALTEAHGGSVDAGSAGLGKGATFTVRLPLLTPSDPQRAIPAASVGAGRIAGMRALVVDDDADARELLAMTLESAGAIPLLASSVREALRLLEQEHPDLLLADLAMPEQDGLDLIRIVRALPEEGGGRVPAIAVTAYASGAERDKALHAGYDAHVAKPYDTEALLAAIANVTASRTP
jgi:signal transduction histidine kinase/ActR/RegA family two-component response regulator